MKYEVNSKDRKNKGSAHDWSLKLEPQQLTSWHQLFRFVAYYKFHITFKEPIERKNQKHDGITGVRKGPKKSEAESKTKRNWGRGEKGSEGDEGKCHVLQQLPSKCKGKCIGKGKGKTDGRSLSFMAPLCQDNSMYAAMYVRDCI